MKLAVFNGSPRKGKNNTELLINEFLQGFSLNIENSSEVLKLNDFPDNKKIINKIIDSNLIFLAFPLYNYFMPSGVKELIEDLLPYKDELKNKKIFFLIQYGFPEAIHARPLEKYLEKITNELDMIYLGTIIKGGCNNLIDEKQNFLFKKIFKGIYEIGKIFGKTETLDKKLILRFSKPENITFISKFFMKIFMKIINKYYWSAELIKNGVMNKAYDRPYFK